MPKFLLSGERAVISRSSRKILPSLGCTKPAIDPRMVVLPDPEGPRRVTKLPFSISRLTSSTAISDPYRFERFLSLSECGRASARVSTMPPLSPTKRLHRATFREATHRWLFHFEGSAHSTSSDRGSPGPFDAPAGLGHTF